MLSLHVIGFSVLKLERLKGVLKATIEALFKPL